MEITILIDRTEILPEARYIAHICSQLLDATFTVNNLSTHNKQNSYIIAYCTQQSIPLISQLPLLHIVPDMDFWDKYLDNYNVNLSVEQSWELPIIGSNPNADNISLEQDKVVVPADIFVSMFSLVTRLEEVDACDEKLDNHGRYIAGNSIAAKYIETPLVNLYAEKIQQWLDFVYDISVGMRYTGLTVVMSHDIDIPYYYSSRRVELSELKNSLIYRNGKYESWKDLWHYLKYLIGVMPDPYDTFEYMCNVEKKYGVKSTYFILLSEENRWGLNVKQYSRKLKMLVDAGHEIALHPGYTALANESVINQQRDALEQLIGQKIHGVRHHFLRFKIPESYRAISSCGLAYDSSLGFAEKHGFRAGICTPFKPYDTKRRTIIDLWEIPLVVMDGTLKDYENYGPGDALEKIKNIATIVHNAGGVLVFNWHNSFFEQGGVAWRKVYEESLNFFKELDARFCACKQLVENNH